MHDGELDIDTALVRRLIAAQFPQWSHLQIAPVESAGTDNAIFRLGDTLAVRMPRIAWAVEQVEKEQRWLPELAAHLPLDVPVPLAQGIPGEGYPWNWSVCRWLEGENASHAKVTDLRAAVDAITSFIHALQQIDSTGGPPPGSHNSGRGVPLAERDAAVRKAIGELEGMIDTRLAAEVWEVSLRAPVWDKAPRWIHGDLQPGNLLVQDGRIHAVIDFGCLGVGDPACDLLITWNFFTAGTRPLFRAAVGADDGMWIRGRGWGLSVALIALPYYHRTNPTLAEMARTMIAEIFADYTP